MSIEGGHYYQASTGRPVYSIIGKSGKERAPYAKEAIELALFPSVTTVGDTRMKWALVNWMQEQAVRAAFEIDRREMFADENELVKATMAHLRDTAGQRTGADAGTEIHNAIEGYYTYGRFMGPYAEHAQAAVAEVDRLFPDVNDWRAESTFASPLGFGGKVDLHSPATGIVVDFKSKDGDLSKKLAYDQYIQLAAYHQGLELEANVCANVFASRTHPGVVSHFVWDLDTLAKGWDLFRLYLKAWWIEHDAHPSEVLARANGAAA